MNVRENSTTTASAHAAVLAPKLQGNNALPDKRVAEQPPTVCIVVPCYNEQAVLPETIRRLTTLVDRMVGKGLVADASTMLFVDDGSRDATWEIIRDFNRVDARVRGIKLSSNRGHQTALIAGLFAARGDAIVSIDADLQDDIGAIERMVVEYQNGNDVVYGVRRSRKTDTVFKRLTAEWYYRLLGMLGVGVVFNHADYRLLSRRALEAIKQYQEVNLFLRGIVPLVGYRSAVVEYERTGRAAGESKYPLRRMLALAADGVTSFSAAPLRLIAICGIFVSFLSAGMTVWALVVRLTGGAVPGWASSVLPIYFLGGLQLLSTGILGEYVAKIYLESKRRPRYFVDETL